MGKKFPESTVGVLVFNPEKKILLLKSHKWKGKYVTPGGHIEYGEKVEDTVKREVKEETGLDVSDIGFIRFDEAVFDKAFYEKKHFVRLAFSARASSSKVVLNDEAQDFVWVSLEEALKMPVAPYSLKAIKGYLESHGK